MVSDRVREEFVQELSFYDHTGVRCVVFPVDATTSNWVVAADV